MPAQLRQLRDLRELLGGQRVDEELAHGAQISFGAGVLVVILAGAAAGASSTASLSGAFQQSFWWAIGFTAVGVLISFALPGWVPDATAATPLAPAARGPVGSVREAGH